MKKLPLICLLFMAVCSSAVYAQTITYLSPVPNSRLHSRETNIILRASEVIDERTVSADDIVVSGSLSGVVPGSLTVSDDRQTLLFQPERPYSPSETVSVKFSGDVTTVRGSALTRKEFSFVIAPQAEPLNRSWSVNDNGDVVPIKALLKKKNTLQQTGSAAEPLPADFPKFKVDTVTNPAPGYFFLTTTEDVEGIGHYFYMIDNTGAVVKYQRTHGHIYDFKVQPNGLLSYADPMSDWGYAGGSRVVHRVLDSSFALVDSFKAGNGYDADSHEFMMLPNGHVLLHAYDIQYVDMSTVVAGGNPNAIVVGSIMQELDLRKNVVFQWRSWDHIPVTETYMNMLSSAFDYIHINAYDIDTDGNVLICFRNTCDIVKINRMTGEIMWRMGGKKNEFTFIGENEANKASYYTFQHSFRRLPNGNFILFDNGNLHPLQVSRVVEYKIDQVNKIATMVWEYRHTPDVYAPTRGSVQRLANGNTVIGWGSANSAGVGKTLITELSPSGEILFELEALDKMPSYRAQKFVWNAHRTPAADVTIAEVLPGNSYSFNKGDTNRTGVVMTLTDAQFGYNSLTVKRYAHAPVGAEFPSLAPFMMPFRFVVQQSGISSFTADLTFDSTVVAQFARAGHAVVYGREFEGTGMFIPLTTVYNATNKSLTVTTTKFGEFVIGVPEQVTAPVAPTAVSPLHNALVNQTKPVLIRWSAAGHMTGSHIQIAKDSTFANLVLNDSTLAASYVLWNGYEQKTNYYWRAKAINEEGSSGWSTVGRFTTAGVYLTIHYPVLNEKLQPGKSYLVKYENNFQERVHIRLFRNGVMVLKIKDSTENTGRFLWKVPATGQVPDSTYTIRVSSVLDSSLVAVSPLFSITGPQGIDRERVAAESFALFQNYPNPFNPSTTIQFSIPTDQRVTVAIFDVLGKEIATLVNSDLSAGQYSVRFSGERIPSGLYLCRMQAGDFIAVRRLLLLK